AGGVLAAVPPLHRIELTNPRKGQQKYTYTYSDSELRRTLLELERKGQRWKEPVQRYKGLGEMDAGQLAETTMDPRHRMLRRVRIEDAAAAGSIFDLLMGSEVAPRRDFIVSGAAELDTSRIYTVPVRDRVPGMSPGGHSSQDRVLTSQESPSPSLTGHRSDPGMRGAAPVHGQPRPVLTQPVTSPGDPFRGWRIDSSGGTCFSRSKPGIYPGKARQGPGTGRRRERARPMVTERSYPGEAADPYCLRPGEAEKLLAGHPWRRFAVLGDSVAEGAGEPAPGYADEPWCDRIAAALRAHQPDLAYLNLGVGNTSAAQVRATQLPTALVFAPDL